jgi:hypothetical protein
MHKSSDLWELVSNLESALIDHDRSRVIVLFRQLFAFHPESILKLFQVVFLLDREQVLAKHELLLAAYLASLH